MQTNIFTRLGTVELVEIGVDYSLVIGFRVGKKFYANSTDLLKYLSNGALTAEEIKRIARADKLRDSLDQYKGKWITHDELTFIFRDHYPLLIEGLMAQVKARSELIKNEKQALGLGKE